MKLEGTSHGSNLPNSLRFIASPPRTPQEHPPANPYTASRARRHQPVPVDRACAATFPIAPAAARPRDRLAAARIGWPGVAIPNSVGASKKPRANARDRPVPLDSVAPTALARRADAA